MKKIDSIFFINTFILIIQRGLIISHSKDTQHFFNHYVSSSQSGLSISPVFFVSPFPCIPFSFTHLPILKTAFFFYHYLLHIERVVQCSRFLWSLSPASRFLSPLFPVFIAAHTRGLNISPVFFCLPHPGIPFSFTPPPRLHCRRTCHFNASVQSLILCLTVFISFPLRVLCLDRDFILFIIYSPVSFFICVFYLSLLFLLLIIVLPPFSPSCF